jgi:hypothetical protein
VFIAIFSSLGFNGSRAGRPFLACLWLRILRRIALFFAGGSFTGIGAREADKAKHVPERAARRVGTGERRLIDDCQLTPVSDRNQ